MKKRCSKSVSARVEINTRNPQIQIRNLLPANNNKILGSLFLTTSKAGWNYMAYESKESNQPHLPFLKYQVHPFWLPKFNSWAS